MSAARSSTGTETIATAEAGVYRGRFAPSPTGPLHFGSLASALGSYLEARARRGMWALRIENVDRTREVPGAADLIIRTLDEFGFEWDGPIVHQSDRTPQYAGALERLRRDGLAYDCSCSRSEIEANARASTATPDELRYPETCRSGPLHPERPLATRFLTPKGPVTFVDAIQGEVSQDAQAEVGDFVVRRRDGYFAYQLAVVIDDADLGITHVVRGGDLLDNTPRQILLQRALGLPTPNYAHLPLAVDAKGIKLSKSAQSVPIDPSRGGAVLWQALDFLRQAPPASLAQAPLKDLWSWALEHWDLSRLRGLRSAPAPAA
ncbi:MAG: tRNA glutamyl-Q(34) synthetase GluQRS [Steroidobacteraceae bacterium]